MLYNATTRKAYFLKQLRLSMSLNHWYKYLYYKRILCIDYSKSELQGIYHLWQISEERKRTVIMSLMCF
jgi:hypothetical protein